MKPKKYLEVQLPRLRIPLWWPNLKWNWRSWLPSRGNVLFTLIVVASLIWASKAGALSLNAPSASAPSTGTIAYQGRLADTSGSPLTGTYSMIFRLYSAATGGAPLWTEQWTGPNSVQVSDGLFNVMLGSVEPIQQSIITGNNSLWLGITVGTDDEMAPRVQLGSVPFAVQALTVADGNITTEKLADGSITTEKLANGSVTAAKLNLVNGLDVATTSNGVSAKFAKSNGRGDMRIVSAEDGSSGIGGFSVDNFNIYEQGLKRITIVDGNVGIGTTNAPNYKLDVNGSMNANSYSVGGSYGQIAQGLQVNGTGPFTVALPSPAWSGLLVLSLKFYGNPAGALIWVNSGNGCSGWDSCATAVIVAKSGNASGGNACNINSVSISPGYSNPLIIDVSGAGCAVAEKKAYVIGN